MMDEFIFRGKGSDISNDFLEPIVSPIETHVAKLGLKNFATYDNIPNIEKQRNNLILIKVPGKENYELFSLDTGAYKLKIIAQQMIEWFEINHQKLNFFSKMILVLILLLIIVFINCWDLHVIKSFKVWEDMLRMKLYI